MMHSYKWKGFDTKFICLNTHVISVHKVYVKQKVHENCNSFLINIILYLLSLIKISKLILFSLQWWAQKTLKVISLCQAHLMRQRHIRGCSRMTSSFAYLISKTPPAPQNHQNHHLAYPPSPPKSSLYYIRKIIFT